MDTSFGVYGYWSIDVRFCLNKETTSVKPKKKGLNKFQRADHGLLHPREGTWAVWQIEAARFQGFTLCYNFTDCMFTLRNELLITSSVSSLHQSIPKHTNQIFASQGRAMVARLAGGWLGPAGAPTPLPPPRQHTATTPPALPAVRATPASQPYYPD